MAANWTGGVPVQADTVSIVSVGTGPLSGNVNINYVPIPGVTQLSSMEMRPSFGNTLQFFYQWPTANLVIDKDLEVLQATTFRHTNGSLTVGDLLVRDGGIYQIYLNSTPDLTFDSVEISQGSRLQVESGQVTAATGAHTMELQATGGVPEIRQTGGTVELGRLLMNYEGDSEYNLTGGTLRLRGDEFGVGLLQVGTAENEPGTPAAATGKATFRLGGTGILTGDDVVVTLGESGRVGAMEQSGTSSADLNRLLVGLQSDGTYALSGGSLDVETMLAVGGDGGGASGTGDFTQTGGAVTVRSSGGSPAQLVVGGSGPGVLDSVYTYSGGTLEADLLTVKTECLFDQSNNRSLTAGGIQVQGTYFLDSGSVTTNAITVDGGGFVHQDATVILANNGDPFDYEMRISGGNYSLSVGSLYNFGDLLVQNGATFSQIGALEHIVGGGVLLSDGAYTMNGFAFGAGSLRVAGASEFNLDGGTLTTPTAVMEGGDFHFNGGDLDTPSFLVSGGTVHFDADGTLAIDEFDHAPTVDGPLVVPSPRVVTLAGDLRLRLAGGLEVQAGASLDAVNLFLEPGNTVDVQQFGSLILSGDLDVDGIGSSFEQWSGSTSGRELRVSGTAAYRHRDGATSFQATRLGEAGGGKGNLLALQGTCDLGPLSLREGSGVEVGSATVTAGVVTDQAGATTTQSITQVGGQVTVASLNLVDTEVAVEGGVFTVTGSGQLGGTTSFQNEAQSNFGGLTLGGSAGLTNVAGATLAVTGNLQVATDGESFNLAGGLVDVDGLLVVSQATSNVGVVDISGTTDCLVGSDFEVGLFGAAGGTVWHQAGNSRMSVTGTTEVGATGLTGAGQGDQVLLSGTATLFSNRLLVGSIGKGGVEQRNGSGVVLTGDLLVGGVSEAGEYLLTGGSLEGVSLSVGSQDSSSSFTQTGGTAEFTGAATNAGTFVFSGDSFIAASFTNQGEATLEGRISTPVTNNGLMRIGPVGSGRDLGVVGSFTNAPGSVLEMAIVGAAGSPGASDLVAVRSSAALAGRLDLKVDPTLAPTVTIGDRWRIISASSRSGSFSTVFVSAPGLPANHELFIEYGADYVDVVVRPVGLTYETWIKGWGLAAEDQGLEDDPNGNGLANVIEFALGTNPAVAGPTPISTLFDGGGFFTLTFPKPPYRPLGIVYGAEILVRGSEEWEPADLVEDSDLRFTARVRVDGPIPEAALIRLTVTY